MLKGAISLAMLSAGLAVVPIISSTAAPSVATAAPRGDELVAQLRDEASGRVDVSRETSTGQVGFVRTTGDLLPSEDAATGAGAAAKATAFLDEYAAAFGAPADQLVQSGVRAHRFGWTVTFTQSYRGVPVFAGELHAQVNRAGDLTAVNGFVAPDVKGGVDPRLSAGQAGDKAVSEVRSDPPVAGDGKADVTGIAAASKELVVYRTGAIRGDSGTNVLAYVVEVTNKANVRDTVILDARSGKVLNRYSMIDNALEREVYEAGGTADSPTFTLVWEEGDPFPGSLNQDQRNLVEGTGDSYWLMQNAFGRDSFDGEGGTMIRSTTTRGSTAPTPTGTASPPTTAPV